MADARIEIDDLLEGSTLSTEEIAPHTVQPARVVMPWLIVVALGLALVLALATRPSTDIERPSSTRFVFITESGPPLHLAASPDGRHVAFVAVFEGTPHIWIRSRDSLTSNVLAGSANALFPFWSPDGDSIGFLFEGKVKRLSVTGGATLTLADAPLKGGGGAPGTRAARFCSCLKSAPSIGLGNEAGRPHRSRN